MPFKNFISEQLHLGAEDEAERLQLVSPHLTVEDCRLNHLDQVTKDINLNLKGQ
jgi:hypothetical protein